VSIIYSKISTMIYHFIGTLFLLFSFAASYNIPLVFLFHFFFSFQLYENIVESKKNYVFLRRHLKRVGRKKNLMYFILNWIRLPNLSVLQFCKKILVYLRAVREKINNLWTIVPTHTDRMHQAWRKYPPQTALLAKIANEDRKTN